MAHRRFLCVPVLASLVLAACGGAAAGSPPAAGTSASRAPVASSAPASAAVPASQPAAPSRAATTVSVAFTSFTGNELPLWVAMDAGIFQRHGLDVKATLLQESPAVAALLSGGVQVIQGGGGGMLASAAEGSDLMVTANVSPYFNFLFVVPNSIKTAADLKGKKLGIAPRGGAVWLATRITLKRLGLNPDTDVTQVSMGVTSERAAALESGALDGSILDVIVGQKLADSGKFHVLYDLAAQKVPYPASTVARKSWLAGHHDVMQRYVDALIEGVQRTKQDPALAVASYKKYSKSDDAIAKATYDYFNPLLLAQPIPKPEDFAEVAQVMAGVNPKVANVDLKALIDPSFVESAISRSVGTGSPKAP